MSYLYNIALQDEEYSKIKDTKEYIYWKNMIKRCYSKKYQINRPTYKDCVVCDEWLTFSNFKEWFYKNYYEIENEKIHLDKDIIKKGNKLYSPNTCIFVPHKINTIFLTNKSNKNNNLPIGVCKTANGNYKATCSVNGKNITIGTYKTIQEAESEYKKYKYNNVKCVLNNYKDKIPKNIYNNIKQSIYERIENNEL